MVDIWKGVGVPLMGKMTVSYRLSKHKGSIDQIECIFSPAYQRRALVLAYPDPVVTVLPICRH